MKTQIRQFGRVLSLIEISRLAVIHKTRNKTGKESELKKEYKSIPVTDKIERQNSQSDQALILIGMSELKGIHIH
jgi:uncharacterized NAD-dependent epimerase/dehydratase family protein